MSFPKRNHETQQRDETWTGLLKRGYDYVFTDCKSFTTSLGERLSLGIGGNPTESCITGTISSFYSSNGTSIETATMLATALFKLTPQHGIIVDD